MNVFFIILIIYFILLIINNTRYFFWYPTINTDILGYGVPYPDNQNEIGIILKDYISKKTQIDIDFFKLTDISCVPAFQTIISQDKFSKKDMNKLIFSPKVSKQIYIYKRIYNRARPHQVAPKLINIYKGTLLQSKTAFTPAYPSGHAFQSYYLARVLSIKFPDKKTELIQMARRISDIRIIAGLHFPSDRDFAFLLVDRMFINSDTNHFN
jgi:phosphorylcholine metabolism protein LicD